MNLLTKSHITSNSESVNCVKYLINMVAFSNCIDTFSDSVLFLFTKNKS